MDQTEVAGGDTHRAQVVDGKLNLLVDFKGLDRGPDLDVFVCHFLLILIIID